MFDLKYYNKLSKADKYFDEDKGNCMSRQYLHKIFSYKNGKPPDFWTDRINELPNDDLLKQKTEEFYAKYGEKGITNFSRMLHEEVLRGTNKPV